MKNNVEEVIVSFKGKPLDEPFFESQDFKMYSFDVNLSEYPEIKSGRYGNVVVKGDLVRLSIRSEYIIKAKELYDSRYGYSYSVINIKSSEIKSSHEMYTFLSELLTPLQAEALYSAYPDIVQRVIDNNLKDVDLSKLKGIGESTFAKIISKIQENYQFADLISEFNGLFSFAVIKKLYNKYSSIEMIKKKLQSSPYEFLTSLDNIGFKKADKIILDYEKNGKLLSDEPLKCSKQRCKAFITYTLSENMKNGNTCMDIIKLQKQCINEVKDCANYFVECVREDNFYYNKELKIIMFKNIYEKEKYIADKLKEALSSTRIDNFDIEKYRNCGEFALTDEQMQAFVNTTENNVSMLIGGGGCGKTATTETMTKMFDDYKKSYLLFAPTGKAAKVLASYTNKRTATIHRGLGYNPTQGWVHNKDNPLSVDYVIVDEFSMVDILLFFRLIDAIDFNRTKLIMIGDSAQLASVSAGNCLHDMINSGIIPVALLTKVFRYGKGGVATASTDCKNQIPYLDSIPDSVQKGIVTHYGENRDFTFVRCQDADIIKDTLAIYSKLIKNEIPVDDIIVTSAYNVGDYGVVKLNNLLQRIANKNYGSEECFKVGQTTYYIGDVVMQTVNNYNSKIYDVSRDRSLISKLKNKDCVPDENDNPFDKKDTTLICNGESGRIVKILKYGVVIEFDSGCVVYNNKEMQTCQLGYACTIHKMQGDARKYVIILSPKAHTFMLSSNLLYVALTRTKTKCYQLGLPSVIKSAVKKKDEEKRKTLLKYLLKD